MNQIKKIYLRNTFLGIKSCCKLPNKGLIRLNGRIWLLSGPFLLIDVEIMEKSKKSKNQFYIDFFLHQNRLIDFLKNRFFSQPY